MAEPTVPVFNDEMMKVFQSLMTRNASMSRWGGILNQMGADQRRDLYKECGYPDTSTLTPEIYKRRYLRDEIAQRVVEFLPKETWKSQPDIFEDPNEDVDTPFEEAVKELAKGLRGKSWFKDNEGNPIWQELSKADELCGIGSFGVVLFGFDDNLPLSEPVKGVIEENSSPVGFEGDADEGGKRKKKEIDSDEPVGNYSLTVNLTLTEKKRLKLIYLRSFDESLVQVAQYEMNMSSPRFNQPVMYLVTLNDPELNLSGIGMPSSTVYVHWTRVLHIADNACGVPWFGKPRMQPVFNRLLDIEKVTGASGEGYWRGAILQIFLSTHPSLGGDVTVDDVKLKEMMENMEEGFQRWGSLMGMIPTPIAPAAIDPTPWVDLYITMICIKLGIPMRKFKGSERGELSSTEDEGDCNDVIRGRQMNFATPMIIVPFFDRLIMVGVLPEPKTPPKLEDKSEDEGDAFDKSGEEGVKRPPKDVPQTSKPTPKFSQNALGVRENLKEEDGKDNSVEVKSELGYSIKWPDLDSLSAQELAQVALQRTQAMGMYVQQGVEALITPKDWLIKELKFTEEDAQSMMDNVMKHLIDSHPDTEDAIMPGHIPAPPTPELPPNLPVKMGQGETLVDPGSGKAIHKTPAPPVAARK